ncbi:aldose epimerase family protein [Levilactobacillus sp. HBUAS70063]|uniref:aldose epimerase family protein n=1 Tax=Levilactobacillus sp. HBUAS70063 TaxID=3109359 RepID=UPI003132A1EE
MKITKTVMGTIDNQSITQYLLTNQQGTRVSVLSWGATLQEFSVIEGTRRQQLVVGEPDLAAYDHNGWALCQALGRVAGRIGGAQFDLDGQTVHLEAGDDGNAIHGGPHGFRNVNWTGTTHTTDDTASLDLTYTATPADDRYPGTLTTTITYTLTAADRLEISFTGKSDADTLFNPTIHTYFNVTDDQQSLDQQWLLLSGDHRLELDATKVPTGKKLPTVGTGYDFSQPRKITDGLKQLKEAGKVEYDDAFEVVPSATTPIAAIGDVAGHRRLAIYSDRNGLVVFTANPTDPKRAAVRDYNALALEAQALPDAIHHQDFGDIVLPANQSVTHKIAYQYLAGTK